MVMVKGNEVDEFTAGFGVWGGRIKAMSAAQVFRCLWADDDANAGRGFRSLKVEQVGHMKDWKYS
jgi:hypothetical protein